MTTAKAAKKQPKRSDKSPTLPAAPHPNKDVFAMMVRRSDPSATQYVIEVVRLCDGHITNAAKAMGISHRVIYKWAAANPKFKSELGRVAVARRKSYHKLSRESRRRILEQRGKKPLTQLAKEEGVSLSCVSRFISSQ